MNGILGYFYNNEQWNALSFLFKSENLLTNNWESIVEKICMNHEWNSDLWFLKRYFDCFVGILDCQHQKRIVNIFPENRISLKKFIKDKLCQWSPKCKEPHCIQKKTLQFGVRGSKSLKLVRRYLWTAPKLFRFYLKVYYILKASNLSLTNLTSSTFGTAT